VRRLWPAGCCEPRTGSARKERGCDAWQAPDALLHLVRQESARGQEADRRALRLRCSAFCQSLLWTKSTARPTAPKCATAARPKGSARSRRRNNASASPSQRSNVANPAPLPRALTSQTSGAALGPKAKTSTSDQLPWYRAAERHLLGLGTQLYSALRARVRRGRVISAQPAPFLRSCWRCHSIEPIAYTDFTAGRGAGLSESGPPPRRC
jgi:hypothetical protein